MKSIFLVGFMGAGKTTVGKLLAEAKGFSLYDTDKLIEEEEQKSISDIFSSKGEQYFRDLESRKLIELETKEDSVFSTGGGIILREKNLDILNRNLSIYLKASYENIFKRIEEDRTRPLLNTDNPYETGRQLFESRKEIYESFSHCVETDNLLPEDVTSEILKIYANSGQD
ncbi:MAG: shikimate kinase [Thermodesulfobacteriota bacterium]|nr:MAG: shikimate kinase [Candidatus Dadabacteria bacterium]|tara:strand:+ start:76 stop:588 length:513 start_codon:yes stop_codon:yes gene_type:complete